LKEKEKFISKYFRSNTRKAEDIDCLCKFIKKQRGCIMFREKGRSVQLMWLKISNTFAIADSEYIPNNENTVIGLKSNLAVTA
jgi:tRNA pseudouridine-54 N-methylase